MLHFLFLFLAFTSQAAELKFEKQAENLGQPWGLVFIDQHRMLITEKSGTFKIFDLKKKKIFPVSSTLKVAVEGQGGLLDVAIDSDFSKSKTIYFTYSKSVGELFTTALGKAQLIESASQTFELLKIQEIFVALPAQEDGIHFGSRIVVTDSEIWMTVGERNQRNLAQDLNTHMGKVLKLDKTGAPHPTNPFLSDVTKRSEIWSYGHRNPQGLLMDLKTKELWVHEHGPRGGDEINLVKRAANYGWPVVSYGREYYGPKIGEGSEKSGVEKPVHFYVPSIAPSGFAHYTSTKIPELTDSFLLGSLAMTHLNQVKIKNQKMVSEKRHFENQGLRIREVEAGPEGHVFFSTDSGDLYEVLSSKNQ